MSWLDTLLNAFRDYVTDGIPASGESDPPKSEIRAGFEQLNATIEAVLAGQAGGMLAFETLALLEADTSQNDGTRAYVWGDSTAANNTFYLWDDGGSAWVVDEDLVALLTGPQGADGTLTAASEEEVLAQTDNTKSVTPSNLATAVSLDEYGPDFYPLDFSVGGNTRRTTLYARDTGDGLKLYGPPLSDEMLAPAIASLNASWRSSGERLRRFLKKLAVIKAGGAAQIRIGCLGSDSWWDRPNNGTELLARFDDDGIVMCSSGYIPLNPELGQANGVTLTQGDGVTALDDGANPWTFEDGSDGDSNAFYSASGNAISTITNSRTGMATGIKGETIHLSYRDTLGAFRYRVNGGSYTTVTGANSGDVLRIQIATGLTAAGPHTLEWDTSPNTPGETVLITDLYANGTTLSGVQFNKMANGESTCEDWPNWIDAWVREATAMDLDLVIVGDGINSQRTGIMPATFLSNMQALLDAFHVALPYSSALLICPPRSSKDAEPNTWPMQDFGDQYQRLFTDNDFTDLVRLDKLWGSYAEESQTPSTWDGGGLHLLGDAPHKRYIGSFYDTMFKRYF